MERKIKHVAIYVRKSRDNNESLEGQIASNIDFCKRYDWEYEIFAEEGSASSEDWDRPELQRMMTLIEKQHFDAVVVTEQSRISRSDDFPKFRRLLQDTNCLFITTQTNSVYDYNKPEDEFVSDIMTAVAKQEIAFSKLRLKRGTVQSAKKGNWLGKKCPVGYIYNKDTKRLQPSEDAHVIQRMFQEYMNGLSTTDIANKFTLEKVQTTVGLMWSSAGISRLLNNPVYIGCSIYGRTTKKNGKRGVKTSVDEQIIVEDTHEAIIDNETWDEVQRIKLQRNSRPLASRLGKHKFSGLIKCKLCGRTHSFQSSKGGKLRINSCQTRHQKGNSFTDYTICPNKSANVDEFEQLFFAEFGKRVNELEQYIDLIKSNDQPQQDKTDEQIKMYERQLKKIDQEIKRIQQGFLAKIFTIEEAANERAAYDAQKERIEKELKQLNETLNSSSDDYLDKVLQRLKDFMTGHSDMPETEANEILREFIDTILYKKLDKEMELNIVWKK